MGKYLAWRSQARAGYESDKFRLMLYDRAAKTTKDVLKDARLPNWAPANFDLWVDEFAWSFTSTDGVRHILFVSQDKGEANIYETYLDGGQLTRYSKMAGEWSNVQLVTPHSWPLIIGSLMRVDRPSEVVLGDLTRMDPDRRTFTVGVKGGAASKEITPNSYQPRQLTHLNDALLAQLDLPKMESFWFTAADGTKVQGFLIRPPGFDAAKKYPVKFLIHGGPQGAWGDAWSYRWNAELFAANGYVVVMINPRGSTGYGQAFVDGVNGDWGGKPFTDLMEGLDYAEQHYPFIDKIARVRAGRELRRLHGELGAGAYGPLQVHREPRRHVQCRVGVWVDGRGLVQHLGVQGASVGLLRQAGRGESLPQVVADALCEKLQDADAGDSWRSWTTGSM